MRSRKKYWKYILCAGLISGSLLVGCGKGATAGEQAITTETVEATTEVSSDPVSVDLFAMDTYMTMAAYGENAENALEAAKAEIGRIEETLSTGIETSEISKLNQEGSGAVSDVTLELVKRSKELYESTGGLFDITIYPLMEAWGFTTKEFQVPEEENLKALMKTMGADQIKVDEQEKKITLGKEDQEIDLGGIAKGYTSGRVMEILKAYGVEHAVISLGGNVQVLGTKADGSKWRIAIEDPENPQSGSYVGIVSATDKAVITSGGYERYFEQDGITYHHILDPRTGYPADSGLISVSIVSADSTLADGLSTSLFIMGKEDAISYWREHAEEFDIILVEEGGAITISEGLKDDFSSDRECSIAMADGSR